MSYASAQAAFKRSKGRSFKMRAFLATLLALSAVGSAVAVMPQCGGNYVKNPFADVCGCNEQVFTQSNCTEAFWCADSVTNTGCRLTCGDDQHVEAGSTQNFHRGTSV